MGPADRRRRRPGQDGHRAGRRRVRRAPGRARSRTPLDGLRIAVDCANGAASEVGPQALRAAGADVVVINGSPDGRNINEKCGSTHPEQLQAVTVASGADLGVAFDGDADRCLAVDHTGALVDGDQIMGVLAIAMRDAGTLAARHPGRDRDEQPRAADRDDDGGHPHRARPASATGTCSRRCGPGGYSLGGEQSGHVIMAAHATTGDGVLTALHLASRVAATGQKLSELAGVVQRLPQVLVNVAGVDKARSSSDAELLAAVARAEVELGDTGRVLLRPSGTESLVRVMVEAASEDDAERIAGRARRRRPRPARALTPALRPAPARACR